jgi:ATP-dependent Clp protease adaptor protein ClpS
MSREAGSRAAALWLTHENSTAVAELLVRPRSALAEAPAVQHETKEKQDLDLPWQVVVHNDPVNLMTYVTMVFQKVFGFTREKAEKHMLEVHRQGRSIVWSGMRERAELYVQQLHGYLLLATIERLK